MKIDLTNKKALVTASSGGIGLAIAESLARSGAKVFINGRNSSELDKAERQIEEVAPDADVNSILADASSIDGIEKILKEAPSVDILINNLGFYTALDFFEINDSDWEEMLNVNFMSSMRLSRGYLKQMLGRNEGRIIFIASEVGLNPDPGMIHYSVSKAAMLSLSRGLAELTKDTNVTVNSIAPGPTATEGLTNYIQELFPNISAAEAEKRFMNDVRPTSLIGRLAKTEEIAGLVSFVSSDLGGAINGATIKAEGGTVRSFV